MNLDEILSIAGDYGKYQKLIMWSFLLPAVFPCGFHAYNQLFMTQIPEHWCRIPELQHLDLEQARNISIPLETTIDGKIRFSQCRMYNLNYSELATIDSINLTTIETVACKNGWIYVNYIENSTIVSEWNLVCDRDLSTTLALILLGGSGLVGNYIFGYIQDSAGRKPAFFIYLLIECIFGIATAFATNFTIWTIFRVGVGFTVPAILATPYVLAIELVGAKQRTLITILINIAYSFALISLAIIVWAIRDWRLLALATSLPFVGFFGLWWFIPESPRWLIAQNRLKDANRILTKIARINGKTLPENYFLELKRFVDNERKFEKSSYKSYGIKSLFITPNLRWKTLLITFLWFTTTSVYVGLSYYAPSLAGDEYLNFFLAGAVELPTYIFLWPALEKWGRRWTLCVSLIVGGSACLATFLVENDNIVTLGLYCIGKMGTSSAFVVVPLMASELYPTVVRGLGMSVSSMMGMLGPTLIPLVNYLGTNMLSLPLIVMGAMLVLGGICSLLLPETVNQPLPQTLQDAEEIGLDSSVCCTLPEVPQTNK